VAKDTLYGMLDHLEDAFLLTSIGLATTSPRRRQVNPRKIYPVDTGLALLFDRSGKLNLGHALETVVLHELQRRQAEIGYVRTQASYEVDFHARSTNGNEELIQVCASLDDPDTLRREVRALEDAQQDFPLASLHLIAMDIPATVAVPDAVQLHKASDWLLRQYAY
jgi:predicted AAA+ superfamily ATPase